MAANLFQPSLQRALDASGNPVSGARLYLFLTGTTTPATYFLDQEGTTPGTNPHIADSSGKFSAVYLDPDTIYRVRQTDATGATVFYDVDPVRGYDIGMIETAAETVLAAEERVEGYLDIVIAATDLTAQNTEYVTEATEVNRTIAAAQPYYPGARTYVPKGLLSVAITAPGTGGTNGTYIVPLSGDNLTADAFVNVTVAGGAVTAVSVNSPGLLIAASVTIGTVDLSSITGLTGATVTPTGGALVSSGKYYYTDSLEVGETSLFQNVSGTATLVTEKVEYLARRLETNSLYDPYMRKLGEEPFYGTIKKYLGTFTPIDADSPASPAGGSLTATGANGVRRIYTMAEAGLRPGEVATIALLTNTTATHTNAVSFRNAAAAATGSTFSEAISGTGWRIDYLRVTAPSDAAFIQMDVTGATGDKKLYGIFALPGTAKPGLVEAETYRPSPSPVNLFRDPFWTVLDQGVDVLNGCVLLGANVPGAVLTDAPPESPFPNRKAIYLPPGAAAHDHKMPLSWFNPNVNDVLHLVFPYVATQIVRGELTVREAADQYGVEAQIGDSVIAQTETRGPANEQGYGPAHYSIKMTQAMIDDGAWLLHRGFSGTVVGAAGAWLLTISVAKEAHSAKDEHSPLQDTNLRAMSSIRANTLGHDYLIDGDSIPTNTTDIITDPGNPVKINDVVARALNANVGQTGQGGTTTAVRPGALTGDSVPFNTLRWSSRFTAKITGNWTAVEAAAATLDAAAGFALYTPMVERLRDADMDGMRMIIPAPTNDYPLAVPIGTIADTTDATYYGAWMSVLPAFQEAFPQCRIALATQIYRDRFAIGATGTASFAADKMTVTAVSSGAFAVGYTVNAYGIYYRARILSNDGGGVYTLDRSVPTLTSRAVTAFDATQNEAYPNAAGHVLEDYRVAVRAVGAKLHIPVIELPRMGWNAGNAALNLIDGVHSTQPPGVGIEGGMYAYGQFLARELSQLF